MKRSFVIRVNFGKVEVGLLVLVCLYLVDGVFYFIWCVEYVDVV